MFVFTPTSAYQLMVTLMEEVPSFLAVIYINLCVCKWLVAFVLHLAAAQYSSRIHACARPLLSLSAMPHLKRLPLGQKVRLALYVEKFNIKKRKYGLTYAGFGLVSLGSLAKVCLKSKYIDNNNSFPFVSQFVLLYSEALMYFYTFIHDQH